MSRPSEPTPELSRPVRAEDIAADGRTVAIDANSEERQRLAARFDLLELCSLAAELRLDPVGRGMVDLTGSFRAEVVQRCVVTEAPVASTVEGRVERRFAPAEDLGAPPREEEVTADETEPPEPIIDGVIEAGEPVAEELALALEPFPRAPGVSFDGFAAGPEGGDEAEQAPQGPFAELARLRRRQGGGEE